MNIMLFSIILAYGISAIMILTDNTPIEAYEMLVNKNNNNQFDGSHISYNKE